MNALRKISNFITLAILLVLYAYIAFFVMPHMANLTPLAKAPLDLLFSYNADTAYAHLESFGDIGREKYAHFSLTIDSLYPAVYTALFMVIIMILARYIWPLRLKMHRLALVPIFAFVFDLAENFCIRKLLTSYPERLDTMVGYSSLFSSLKWSSVGITCILILVLMVLAILKKIRTEKF